MRKVLVSGARVAVTGRLRPPPVMVMSLGSLLGLWKQKPSSGRRGPPWPLTMAAGEVARKVQRR